MRTLLVLFISAGLFAATAAAVPSSSALLTDVGSTDGSFATDTLDPPSTLAAAVSSLTVDLSWVASPDSYVTGYDVLRSTTSGSGFGTVGSTAGTAFTDGPVAPGIYYYVARSTFANWRSGYSNEAPAIVTGSVSTGEVPCVSNAADTGGDGNGYEVTPGNACSDDGVMAADMNSGSGTGTSCTGTGKDKHRFWGFAFGLPSSVSAITGIAVRLDGALDSVSGTNRLCAQLSWNSGSSWTAAQSVTPSGASETTYTLSGLWGRAWTAGQLSTSNFRVRVIDVSNVTSRDFFLDYVTVTVTYTP